VYRAPATGTGTGSHYDWLAWHGTGLQATGACRIEAPAPAANIMATQNGVDV